MDQVMIERWNSVVRHGDTVWHVGDFCLRNRNYALSVFRKLHGMIIILDNSMHHDKWMSSKEGVLEVLTASSDTIRVAKQIVEVTLPVVTDSGLKDHVFVLSHFPLFAWPKAFYGSIQLHGHVHGAPVSTENNFPSYDVGVDCNNFTPVNAEHILQRIKERGAT
jgi:calcineurin-like phosphoesterase family protein